MSADKRTVSTDALETLGMIHFKAEARDAIHLAVEPIEAGEDLEPSDDVSIGEDRKAYGGLIGVPGSLKAVGIVDPFLRKTVKKGQRFWLVVYPRMVTSLRHVWEHPDFPAGH